MGKKDSYSQDELEESLSDLFNILTEEQKTVLVKNCEILHYKKNETIYKEGEVPQFMYCILSGKVKIYMDGIGGRQQIIRVVKPVEYYGYRAFFANQNYATSAAAFENSVACLIPMELIVQFLEVNSALGMFFIRRLATELGSSDMRTVNLTQKHIRGRLAEALLFLNDSYGLEEDGATLSIYLSREDLANLSNMTTSNAIRTLSAFAHEHLIAIDGRKIKIMDEAMLRRISRLG